MFSCALLLSFHHSAFAIGQLNNGDRLFYREQQLNGKHKELTYVVVRYPDTHE